jgi:hypothetical protein
MGQGFHLWDDSMTMGGGRLVSCNRDLAIDKCTAEEQEKSSFEATQAVKYVLGGR